MRRRDFIAAFAGVAAAWPLASRAQQPALPTIGFLSGASSDNYQPFVTAFKEGLKQTDYFEGRNVAIEYRWAEDQFDRLPKLAADLVDDRPTMIMASGNPAERRRSKCAFQFFFLLQHSLRPHWVVVTPALRSLPNRMTPFASLSAGPEQKNTDAAAWIVTKRESAANLSGRTWLRQAWLLQQPRRQL
jgi:hypothetical protein